MLGKDVDLELVLKTTERQSRLSFECHGGLLIEGLIEEMTGETSSGNEGGDDGDMFLSFLESHVGRMSED